MEQVFYKQTQEFLFKCHKEGYQLSAIYYWIPQHRIRKAHDIINIYISILYSQFHVYHFQSLQFRGYKSLNCGKYKSWRNQEWISGWCLNRFTCSCVTPNHVSPSLQGWNLSLCNYLYVFNKWCLLQLLWRKFPLVFVVWNLGIMFQD